MGRFEDLSQYIDETEASLDAARKERYELKWRRELARLGLVPGVTLVSYKGDKYVIAEEKDFAGKFGSNDFASPNVVARRITATGYPSKSLAFLYHENAIKVVGDYDGKK